MTSIDTRRLVALVGAVLLALALGAATARAQRDPFDNLPTTPTPTTPPTTPATPSTTPLTPTPAPPTPATTPPPSPPPPSPESLPSPTTGPSPECDHVTAEICDSTNRRLLATSAGYVLVMILLFTIVRVWWNHRGTSTSGVRLLVTLALATAGAGLLVGLDPIRAHDLTCCLDDQTLKSHILLQDSQPGRIALFGVLPCAVLFFLVAFVEKLVKRK